MRRGIIMLLLVLACITSVTTVKAEEVQRIECSGKASWVKNLSNKLNDVVDGFSSYDGKTIILYEDTVKSIRKSERNETLNELILVVVNSNIVDRDKNLVSSAINNMFSDINSVTSALDSDTSKEVNKALSIFQMISGAINGPITFVLIFIAVLIPLSLVNDSAYLVIDIYSDLITPDDNTKPKFISKAAFRTRNELLESDGKFSIILSYLQKQWKPMLFFMILLVIILRGKLYSLFGQAFDYFDLL